MLCMQVFTPVITGDLHSSLIWRQVYSTHLDYSQYSRWSQHCWGQDGYNLFSELQFIQYLFTIFYNTIFHKFILLKTRVYGSYFSLSATMFRLLSWYKYYSNSLWKCVFREKLRFFVGMNRYFKELVKELYWFKSYFRISFRRKLLLIKDSFNEWIYKTSYC